MTPDEPPPPEEAELSRTGLHLRFADTSLESTYRQAMQAQARPHNRLTLPILLALVDIFFIPELIQIPEIVPLSAALRFGLMTPLLVLFVLLDRKGRFGRFYPIAVTLVASLPAVCIPLEFVFTTSPQALPNIQCCPLIQLVTITSRLTVRQAATVNALASLCFIAGIIHSPVVPGFFLPSMVLLCVAISIGGIAFVIRIDVRERQVFLLDRLAQYRMEALSRLAQVDALTGVANRRSFDAALARAFAVARRSNLPLSLIMIDVDHFKLYNDYYGHQAGDDCLRQVARAAHSMMREGDLIARYGGEEFAVILRGASRIDATMTAERLRAVVAGLVLAHEGMSPEARVSISLGLASLIPGSDDGPQDLISQADRNLYGAKKAGRNCVCAEG